MKTELVNHASKYKSWHHGGSLFATDCAWHRVRCLE